MAATWAHVARWALLCAAAEMLGLAAAGAWYGAAAVALGEPEPLAARITVWMVMAAAAIPEGFVLGGLQAYGLKRWLPGLSAPRWILATIGAGAVGWGVGAFIPLFVPFDAMAPDAGPEPSLAALMTFAGVFGVAAGAIFGLIQATALPGWVRRRWAWIVANVVGWAVGLPLTYLGAQMAADLAGWGPRLALWALGGLGAGLSIGLATGLALPFMAADARGGSKAHGTGREAFG